MALLLAASPAFSQVTTGLPPFGSFSGGPDIVNNANLNVHLSIPVVNKAGRGMPFNYTLGYDSSIWYPVGATGSQVWTPLVNWGWPGVTPVTSGYFTSSTYQANCFYPPGANGKVYWYTIWSAWAYTDAGGATHWLPIPGGSVSNAYTTTPCTNGPWYTATATANDGSGWAATVYAGGQGTAYYRNGDTLNAALPYSAGPIVDPNGNQITNSVQGTTTTFTDTLATTVLTVSKPTPTSSKPWIPVTTELRLPARAPRWLFRFRTARSKSLCPGRPLPRHTQFTMVTACPRRPMSTTTASPWCARG